MERAECEMRNQSTKQTFNSRVTLLEINNLWWSCIADVTKWCRWLIDLILKILYARPTHIDRWTTSLLFDVRIVFYQLQYVDTTNCNEKTQNTMSIFLEFKFVCFFQRTKIKDSNIIESKKGIRIDTNLEKCQLKLKSFP